MVVDVDHPRGLLSEFSAKLNASSQNSSAPPSSDSPHKKAQARKARSERRREEPAKLKAGVRQKRQTARNTGQEPLYARPLDLPVRVAAADTVSCNVEFVDGRRLLRSPSTASGRTPTQSHLVRHLRIPLAPRR
ncbi:MAG: DUF6444 domain-containing protein [Acidimicrobiales bacterium]